MILRELGEYGANGGTWTEHRAIGLDPGAEGCESVMAHEMGHSAGLAHASEGLMSDPPLCSQDLDTETAAAFCAEWGC